MLGRIKGLSAVFACAASVICCTGSNEEAPPPVGGEETATQPPPRDESATPAPPGQTAPPPPAPAEPDPGLNFPSPEETPPVELPQGWAVDDANNLVKFPLGAPGLVTTMAIKGLVDGERIIGLDIRPADKKIYALGTSSRIYTLDKKTAPKGFGEIEVYTTRPDTLFCAAFVALAPDHPLAKAAAEKNPELAAFCEECRHMGTSVAELETAEKQGFDTGIRAVHPFDKSWSLPVFVANFILMDYGTGAIFGCPSGDQRDWSAASLWPQSMT